jgi:hypothetical protein
LEGKKGEFTIANADLKRKKEVEPVMEEIGQKKMQNRPQVSSRCACLVASSLCSLAVFSPSSLLSIVVWRASPSPEHGYFLFLIFLALGCLPRVNQSVHIVLEKSITLSLLVEAAENERDPEVDVLKKGGRRRQGRRGRGLLIGTCLSRFG